MRNMSFALTTPQILAQTKDVTRRMGWLFLKPGDLIQPVKKAMGLRKGESIVKLGCPLLVVTVRREPPQAMVDDLDYGFVEVAREGFADDARLHWPSTWIEWFAATHRCTVQDLVTRIEFAYTVPIQPPAPPPRFPFPTNRRTL